jgi:hypothetical protein
VSLTVGGRFGVYEVTSHLGTGGMGEVNSVADELTRETLTVQTNWTSTLEK